MAAYRTECRLHARSLKFQFFYSKTFSMLATTSIRPIANLPRKWVRKCTDSGTSFYCTEPIMPRIPDEIMECVVYVYKSKTDALNGAQSGGTGFFVGIRSQVFDKTWYTYCVTNAHIVKRGSTVIRLNKRDGGVEVFDLTLDNWILDPSGSDLAVCNCTFDPALFSQKWLGSDETFLTDEIALKHNLGVGDDTFMIGRFVSHEGKLSNTPALRFGNISMMPKEPISHDGHREISYLVEVRSVGGYSGSPVFVHVLPMSLRHRIGEPNDINTYYYGPWLLGVNWGYLHNRLLICEGREGDFKPLIGTGEGWNVADNTGMAAVVPVWKLRDLLNTPILKNARDESERLYAQEKAMEGITLS